MRSRIISELTKDQRSNNFVALIHREGEEEGEKEREGKGEGEREKERERERGRKRERERKIRWFTRQKLNQYCLFSSVFSF